MIHIPLQPALPLLVADICRYSDDQIMVPHIYEAALEGWNTQICVIECYWIFNRGQYWPSGIVVACVCVCVCVSVCGVFVSLCVNHLVVQAITRGPFKLGSLNWLNWNHRCTRPRLRSLLFLKVIALDHQGQIELQSQNLNHFELVRAKTQDLTTKFGPQVQNNLVKIPFVLGVDWIDISNLTQLKNYLYLHRFCVFEIFVKLTK